MTVLLDSSTQSINVDEGYELVPVELSLVYQLPFRVDPFSFFIGGGIGYYYGNHIRKPGDIYATTTSRASGYGIQTLAGTEYKWNSFFSLIAGMKFSDPQIKMTNIYNKTVGTINGHRLEVGQTQFNSKLNVDGVLFFLGTRFYIF